MKAELVNIENVSILTDDINEVAIIKYDTAGQQMLLDVANLKQSTIASDVYINYVSKINKYNTRLYKMIACRKLGFISTLWWGYLPILPENLVPIVIKKK